LTKLPHNIITSQNFFIKEPARQINMKAMKIFTLTLLSLLAAGIEAGHSSSGDGPEGELEISRTCDDKDVSLECEWKAKGEDDKRGLRKRKARGLKRIVEIGGRRLEIDDVALKDVECTLKYGGQDEATKSISFPDDWTIIKKEGDGADDYYGFSITVVFSGVKNDGSDVEGELEVEIEVGEDDEGNDELNYDDAGIGVSC
jgi:hypothetical protein